MKLLVPVALCLLALVAVAQAQAVPPCLDDGCEMLPGQPLSVFAHTVRTVIVTHGT